MRDPQSIADRTIHLPVIDGLRGIAVLMVLAVHTSQRVGNVGLHAFQFPLIGEFINAGARGVELFFLLSAFTLFRSSKAKYSEESNPQRNFYLRRAFRILPLWWLTISVYVMLTGRTIGESLPSYLMYFGFIRYEPGVEVFPLGWTIFVEETFYLFLPIIFGFVRDLRRAVFFVVLMLALSSAWMKAAQYFNLSNVNLFMELFPLRHWYAFALGIMLYFIYANETISNRVLQSKSLSWCLDALCVIAVAMTVTGESRVEASCGLALLILAALSKHSIAGWVCRLSVLRSFGVCCYSIYLLHFALLDTFDGLREHLFHNLGLADGPVEARIMIWFPIMAILNLVVCLVVFHGLEKPCVNLGKNLIRRLEADKPAVVPAL